MKASAHGLDYEEKATLLSDKSPSDMEGAVHRVDLTPRFPINTHYAGQWTRTTWDSHRALPNLPTLLRRAAIFLLPSFIQPLFSPSSKQQPPSRGRRPGPTAYLDGVRGLAALSVFFCRM